MRILIATSHRDLVGGVEKYLQMVIPGLLERKHHLSLLHEFPAGSTPERIDSGVELPAWCVAEGVQTALQSVAKWKPDVVYLQGLESTSLEAALLEQYPTILYAHNYHGTCVSGRKCHMTPQPQPCAREMGAACLFLYFPRRCGGRDPRTMWELFQQQSSRKSKLKSYKAILVASRHMYREYQRHGVDPNHLRLVPLPVIDSNAEVTPPRERSPEGRLLMVGRLTDLKGCEYLIRAIPEAAKKLGRTLTVTFAGDGPERENLRKLADQLGVGAQFAGWVDTERKTFLMRESDLLVVPSVWPEPFGLTGVEAGALGLPSVGFAVGGIPEWLASGESGELAPGDPPTVRGLADAIVRALADREHYNKLSLGAWQMARRFSLGAHMTLLDPVLASEEPLALTLAMGADAAFQPHSRPS